MKFTCPNCGGSASLRGLPDRILWCEKCYEVPMNYDKAVNAGLANTPDGAVFMVEGGLYVSQDHTRAMAFTAHKVGDQTAYNTWLRYNGDWFKMMPERVINREPDPVSLSREMLRYESQPALRYFTAADEDDTRWEWVSDDLRSKLSDLVRSSRNS